MLTPRRGHASATTHPATTAIATANMHMRPQHMAYVDVVDGDVDDDTDVVLVDVLVLDDVVVHALALSRISCIGL